MSAPDQSNGIPPAALPSLAMPLPGAPLSAANPDTPGAQQAVVPRLESGLEHAMPSASAQSAAIPGMPVGAGVQSAADSSVTPSQEVIIKAEQLVQTYAGDPFQLATLFNDLKVDYLARQHNISPNTAGK